MRGVGGAGGGRMVDLDRDDLSQEEEDVKKALNKLVVKRKSLVEGYQSASEGEVKEKEPKKKSKKECFVLVL